MTNSEPHPDPDPVDALIALLEDQIQRVDDQLKVTDESIDEPKFLLEPASLPLTEMADDDIEFYAIDLDESERTPNALAARDRILENLGLSLVRTVDESSLSQEAADRTFSALISANLWEDIDTELVVARRGGTSLPSRDLTVPELIELGYRPEVEVIVDFAPADESATLTFLLDPLALRYDASPPPRVRLVVETLNGFQTHALVSQDGIAILTGVPRDQLGHLELRWARA